MPRSISTSKSLANWRPSAGANPQGFILISPGSFFRDDLKRLFKKMGLVGIQFHAFRRFRETVRQKIGKCSSIIGWARDNRMSARYETQLLEMLNIGRNGPRKVGLGLGSRSPDP
jgi:hypothetical protein